MTAEQVQLRRDTAANLNAAIPAEGEAGYDKTNKRLVIGDGTTSGGIKCTMAKDHQNQTFIAGTVGGSADTITLTNAPAVTAYANNQRLTFKAGANNTGAVTVNVDGLGSKNIKKMRNGALAALIADDIVSGGLYDIFYDGTQFQIKGLSEGPHTSGALVYLGTGTASASAQVDLTSLMSSTYDDYLVILDRVLLATGGASLMMRVSTNNGSSFDSTANNYKYVRTTNNGSTLTAADQSTIGNTAFDLGGAATSPMSGKLEFLDANATGATQTIVSSTYQKGSSSYSLSGHWNSTGPVNAIRFLASSGNITSGSFKLYGIAKA